MPLAGAAALAEHAHAPRLHRVIVRARARVPLTALALSAVVAASGGVAPAGAAPSRLVVLEAEHGAFARPDYRSPRLATVRRERPITGVATVLPFLAERTVADGRRWLQVRLPGRPQGQTGWIASRATRSATTPWSLRVDLSARHVTAFQDGRAARTFRTIVGAAATPTPQGRFFVEENVALAPGQVGAPFALALSARSDVLEQFAGGPGQIALHGLGGVGGVLGTAASHGCIRLDLRSIEWLAARIAPGTPVAIVA